MMPKRFTLSQDSCTIGFQEHVRLDLLNPISTQLNRHKLYHRKFDDNSNKYTIRHIIETNSSLRISFGWSFESVHMFESVMDDCIKDVIPKYNILTSDMCSDIRCDWLGFLPFDTFDKEFYKDFSVYDLVLFNNELINFQEEVVKYISDHSIYRQHAMVRDERYRFNTFRSIRKNPVALSEMFLYYIKAVKATSLVPVIPRDIIEQEIGCHFIHHPEVFFEMLEFSILKGDIYE